MNKQERTYKRPDILLVEDDPDHQELALMALQQHGMAEDALIANDGVEAIEFLSRESLPRLVLLDLKLPGMHGFEVLRRIREQTRTRFLPVVILSSSDEERDILRSHELGANSYIVKPVDFDNFAEVARQICAYWVTLNRCPDLRPN